MLLNATVLLQQSKCDLSSSVNQNNANQEKKKPEEPQKPHDELKLSEQQVFPGNNKLHKYPIFRKLRLCAKKSN